MQITLHASMAEVEKSAVESPLRPAILPTARHCATVSLTAVPATTPLFRVEPAQPQGVRIRRPVSDVPLCEHGAELLSAVPVLFYRRRHRPVA